MEWLLGWFSNKRTALTPHLRVLDGNVSNHSPSQKKKTPSIFPTEWRTIVSNFQVRPLPPKKNWYARTGLAEVLPPPLLTAQWL